LIASFLEWRISSSENVNFNLLSILSNLVVAFFTLVESNLNFIFGLLLFTQKNIGGLGCGEHLRRFT
jgi:hypothetical protein